MVYLLGAGPGDPGLLTVKGLELIQTCDTIIYDSLGTDQLLEYVKPTCKKIFAGKRAGSHYMKQDEINELLIAEGKKNDKLVRLKGGDPFVFGRGGEEAMALLEADIPFVIVPGITSAIAVPEVCGIPVTHRGEARSFHVATAHLMSEDDLSYVTKVEGTYVFLMGLSRIDSLVDRLLDVGYKSDTPMAVISKGTLPGQRIVRGNIANIASLVEKEGLEAPAVIVLGENASLDFTSKKLGPLQNTCIGLIGTPKLREKLSAEITNSGGKPLSIVDMHVMPTENKERLKEAVLDIKSYSWLAFTSANAIELFFTWMREWQIDVRTLAHLKFAVIGAGTKAALLQEGYIADYLPDEYTTSAFAKGLVKTVKENEKILIPRAAQGSKELNKILDAAGMAYDEIAIYDVQGKAMEGLKYLSDIDVLSFISASGVRAFFDIIKEEVTAGRLEKNVVEEKLKNIRFASLGEVTEQALVKMGIKESIISEMADVKHLIDAIGKETKND